MIISEFQISINICHWVFISYYFTSGRGAKYCNEYVCLSLRLSVCSHNSKTARPNFTDFCACCPWPWPGPPLTALRYVMYFRFYVRRHVFIPYEVRQVAVPVGCKTPTVFGWLRQNAAPRWRSLLSMISLFIILVVPYLRGRRDQLSAVQLVRCERDLTVTGRAKTVITRHQPAVTILCHHSLGSLWLTL